MRGMKISTGKQCARCEGVVQKVEPGGCLFFFLLCFLSTGFLIGVDLGLGIRLWSWMKPGIHGFGWVWHFIVAYGISATVSALIIRYVFRLRTKEAAYFACSRCGQRYSSV